MELTNEICHTDCRARIFLRFFDSRKNGVLGSEAQEVGLQWRLSKGSHGKKGRVCQTSLNITLVTPRSETRSESSVQFGTLLYRAEIICSTSPKVAQLFAFEWACDDSARARVLPPALGRARSWPSVAGCAWGTPDLRIFTDLQIYGFTELIYPLPSLPPGTHP